MRGNCAYTKPLGTIRMKKIKLNTESFEFKNGAEIKRQIPFYELSMEEWVIYQNGKPKYFLNLDNRESNFQKQIREILSQGKNLEELIYRLGIYLGLDWTTKHNIEGIEVENSYKNEIVELEEINDFREIANDLIYVATDEINQQVLVDDDKLIKEFATESEINLESVVIDREENIDKQIKFLFGTNNYKKMNSESEEITLLDLSEIMDSIISFDDLESDYKNWIKMSERNNSMDEYGGLIGIVGYVLKNRDKKHLILRIEKKKTVPNNG